MADQIELTTTINNKSNKNEESITSLRKMVHYLDDMSSLFATDDTAVATVTQLLGLSNA